ncbi:hypothetical protein ILYODFUR_003266 [Ilyodon furcidens]|uniref:Uncharacterized protein n=2 Tax=Goodeidae TaxID=28758 RepID=A0ABV0MQ56_9TELE
MQFPKPVSGLSTKYNAISSVILPDGLEIKSGRVRLRVCTNALSSCLFCSHQNRPLKIKQLWMRSKLAVGMAALIFSPFLLFSSHKGLQFTRRKRQGTNM